MINLSYKKVTDKWKLTVLLLCSICACCGCGSYEAELSWDTESAADYTEASLSETIEAETTQESIFVYVSGAVQNSGVYELSQGSRLYEALVAAGGMTGEADADALNQARELTDGEHILVLTKEQSQDMAQQQAARQSGLVNINTAGVSELTQLSGIGESRAEAIIAYRQENGSFTQIEDIQKVAGIKAGLYEKIKDKITVG